MSRGLVVHHTHADTPHTLAEREAALTTREAELAAFLADLRALRTRYLEDVGVLYAELNDIEKAIAAEEVRLGIRASDQRAIDDEVRQAEANEDPSCGSRAGIPDALKKMFRNVAKALHPDLEMDDDARSRRHELMAEANRAYADRDEDRLRLIMRAWEESPEAVPASHPYGERLRAERRIGQINERLIQIDAEFAELKDSALNRLKISVDEAASHGRDLFAQMIRVAERELATANKRLEILKRR
jgi:hypothetical protein